MVSFVRNKGLYKEHKTTRCNRMKIILRQRRTAPFLACLALTVGLGRFLQNKLLYSSSPTPAPAPIKPASVQEWTAFAHDYKGRFEGRDPPRSLMQWLSYAQANQCNERDLYSSLEEDLAFYRDIIQREGRRFRQEEIVPHGLQQTDNFIGLHLEQHTLTVVATKNYGNNYQQQQEIEEKLRWILEPVRVHKPPLNATFFFNLHDGASPAKPTTTRPVFSVCKQSYWTEDNFVPTPDDRPSLLRELDEEVSTSPWHHASNTHHKDFNDWASFESRDVLVPYHFGFDTDIPDNPNWLSFGKRKDAIVWRGSTTGSVWGESPRFRLVRDYGGTQAHPLSSTNKDVTVDFAFVDVLQSKPGETLAPNSRHGPKERMSFAQLQEHKYIMDVDGNAFTQRFPGLLRSGSLIFKSTRYKEWYTERLRPFVDYIPVNYNLSDLVEKVEWAHMHPDLTNKMVQHSQNVAKHYLRKEDMRCYVYRLMLEYQSLFEN